MYEYKVKLHDHENFDGERLEKELNEIAQEGWKLFSYSRSISIWKKEKGGGECGGCGGDCQCK